ncbi:MAG: arylsulfatase [Planctomycetaceae bacterium]|nr:arylsulfatase [Planctomycetaceae bacterium]|tara:strand:- start:8715 stop:10208 length:1494 start_codon:yes stop_codon:yes gene_type:complete
MLKNTIATLLLLFVFGALDPAAVTAEERPNIIFIFVDDLGWMDIGCYGNKLAETPHIDKLATAGMRFTDFYAAGAVCSPTRCAVQSGQNQARIGITDFIPGHWRPFERSTTPMVTAALPLDTVTVAESLQKTGYATGYVGKWHLGSGPNFGPAKQGYEFAVEVNGAQRPGSFRVTGRTDLKPNPKQFRTEFEGEMCRQFIRDNKDTPFFLMLSPYHVHIPLSSRSDLVLKYEKKARKLGLEMPHPVYAAMLEEVDNLVGEVVDEVETQGMTNNTMIVFTSDNGGLYRRFDYREHADDTVASQAPLRGEKGTLFEGGIRVPLIVKHPGVVPAGTINSTLSISYDFYPTFVSLAQGVLPANQTIDGVDLLPTLTGQSKKLDRGPLYWHYPHYHHDRPASAIRDGNWKLIQYLDGSKDLELYNLIEDIGEANDLSEQFAGRVADLKNKLAAWQQDVSARMPMLNLSYDPSRAHEWWNRRTSKPVNSDGRKRFPPTELPLK